MNDMSEDFSYFFHEMGFGPAFDCMPVSDEIFEKYKNKLPNQLLHYWRKYGFCGWGEGLFWTVNPADYDDLLHQFLAQTDLLDQDELFVIARTAFGDLYVWAKNSGRFCTISPMLNLVFPRILEQTNFDPDFDLDIFFSSKEKEGCDLKDEKNKFLFDRAKQKLGRLRAFEMYGFVPAIALGGLMELDNLQKVPIQMHLNMLAELNETVIYQPDF
ncbi:GAD-like domain-containing protein [Acinetobacter sichuanensis]|uniref:GAD-like domain-containing protein n=2 Tax=Acinetobacter sichuanensis TaxID=2136183 RepID=A0ABV7BEA8_9GAMM|nr:GAD-like domain-containing protein [Acinetobacter sichuanensis]